MTAVRTLSIATAIGLEVLRFAVMAARVGAAPT